MRRHHRGRTVRYTLMDELMASPDKPLPLAKQQAHLVPMHDGLRALMRDEAPSNDHWRALSDSINMMETLVELGICEDASGLLPDAVQAMAEAGTRHLRDGVALRLSGAGMDAVRAVLEDYDALVPVLPERVMVRCHRHTELRIQMILRGQREPHDVVVKV